MRERRGRMEKRRKGKGRKKRRAGEEWSRGGGRGS